MAAAADSDDVTRQAASARVARYSANNERQGGFRQPGPYKSGYRTERGQQTLKNRQFGPGPNPKIGKSTKIGQGVGY